jgi:hypothetical protein
VGQRFLTGVSELLRGLLDRIEILGLDRVPEIDPPGFDFINAVRSEEIPLVVKKLLGPLQEKERFFFPTWLKHGRRVATGLSSFKLESDEQDLAFRFGPKNRNSRA